LAKSGIAPRLSFVLARWQHKTGGLAAISNWMLGSTAQISPSLGVRTPI